MLQVLPAAGGADGRCLRSIAGAGAAWEEAMMRDGDRGVMVMNCSLPKLIEAGRGPVARKLPPQHSPATRQRAAPRPSKCCRYERDCMFRWRHKRRFEDRDRCRCAAAASPSPRPDSPTEIVTG